MKKSEIQAELWGKSPGGWAEIQEPQHKPLWEAMLNVSEVGNSTIFLDVGCGAGGASALARKRGAEVHGVDVAKELLSFARLQVPDGTFQVGDIENLPYKDGMFDLVFASNSLQYSEDRLAALRELKRVCKPGGVIVAGLFSQPEEVEFTVIFKALRDAMPKPPEGGGPFELSTPGKLEELFTEAGLTNLMSGEVNCPFEYENFEIFWYGNSSAGPFQNILQMVGEKKLKSVVKDAIQDFIREDGRILFKKNMFKYVYCKNESH